MEEEKKRQIEEQRRKNREEQRKQKLRKDECPFLYGIITYRGIDANRLLQIDATKRYVELNCDIWLNDYIRSH